jgi:hypothetical protein
MQLDRIGIDTDLDIYLRPVTTAEIFYAIGIDNPGPTESYDTVVCLAREFPISRAPFGVPEQLKDLKDFDKYKRFIETFPYSEDTNPRHLPKLEGWEAIFTHTKEHIDPTTSLKNNRANCKGIATLAVVLARHMGVPSRYVQDSHDHVKFELNRGGIWTTHNHNNFDKGGSIFEPRNDEHLGELPIRYQWDSTTRLAEKEQFGKYYVALLHELDRLE